MSAVKQSFLMCDKCSTSFGVDCITRSVEQQRKAAKKTGWQYSGNTDYCPDCRPKRKDGKNIKSK